MMKNSTLITLLMLMMAPSLIAQKPVKVLEDSIQIGNYLYPGFNVTVPEANFEITLKNWVKLQETGTKSKVQTENGEMTIFGAIIKEVSSAPVNIYSKLRNEDTLTRLLVTIELKKDQYVEPSTGDLQMKATKDFLKEFAKSEYIEVIKVQLENEEKILRDLNKELGSLENSKTRSLNTAKNNRNTITDEQDKLLVRQNELSLLSNDISRKNSEMISMPVGAGRDAMDGQVKDLEKRRKKLQRDIGKSEKRISKAKSGIDKADRAIPVNEEEQTVLKTKIDEQRAVVQSYVDKLNTVKLY